MKISKTKLSVFRRCPRLFRYRYIDNYAPLYDDSDQLAMGRAFHSGVEQHWLHYHEDPEDRLELMLDAALDGVDVVERPAVLEAMLVAYDSRYAGNPGVNVLATEKTLEASGPNGMSRIGILDAIIELDGRVLVVETKTTKSSIAPNSWYWNKLDLDTQVSLYWWLAEQNGFSLDGLLYDVTQVPQNKQGVINRRSVPSETEDEFFDRVLGYMDKDPGRYFRRCQLTFDPSKIMKNIALVERNLLLTKEHNLWYMNEDSCYDYGTCCQFRGVCTDETSLKNERIFVKKSEKH